MVYHTAKTTTPYQNPDPSQFHDLIFNPKDPEIIWYANCSKQTCYLHLQTSSCRPRSQGILIWTTLSFFTTMKTWSKIPRDTNDRSVDGSCLENWVTGTTIYPLSTQCLMPQWFAPLLGYGFFYFLHWNRKYKI